MKSQTRSPKGRDRPGASSKAAVGAQDRRLWSPLHLGLSPEAQVGAICPWRPPQRLLDLWGSPYPTWEAQMALRGLDEGARQEGASASMSSVPRACLALCRVSRATWSWWGCRALPSPGPVQPQSAAGLERPGTCPQGLFNFLIRTEGLLASQGTPMLTGGSGDRPWCVI